MVQTIWSNYILTHEWCKLLLLYLKIDANMFEFSSKRLKYLYDINDWRIYITRQRYMV